MCYSQGVDSRWPSYSGGQWPVGKCVCRDNDTVWVAMGGCGLLGHQMRTGFLRGLSKGTEDRNSEDDVEKG